MGLGIIQKISFFTSFSFLKKVNLSQTEKKVGGKKIFNREEMVIRRGVEREVTILKVKKTRSSVQIQW